MFNAFLVSVSRDARAFVLAALLGSSFLLSVSAVKAQRAGALDTSFSDDGIASTTFSPEYNAGGGATGGVAVQADNKVVVAGYAQRTIAQVTTRDFAVVRYRTDGALDSSFGADGKVTFNIMETEEARQVIIQPDGKILIGGFTSNAGDSDFVIIRYNSDGSLDNSFNNFGYVRTHFGGSSFSADILENIVLQPDGKIIAVGRINRNNNSDYAVVRYNADGSYDNSFDGDGIFEFSIYQNDIPRGALLQPDGKLVIVGGLQPQPPMAARLNPDGSFDTSFGAGGISFISTPNASLTLTDIALQADNKLVIGGFNSLPMNGGTDFAAIRLNNNGALDTEFGAGGVATTNFTGVEVVQQVIVQPNGKILLAGYVNFTPQSPDFALARFNPNGSPDNSFGTGGKVSTDLGGGSADFVFGAALAKDGKIVVGGSSGSASFVAARYSGNAVVQQSSAFDYDGDGKSDISVFRPSAGDWYVSRSSNGAFSGTHFGASGDLIAPADFDGDGQTDISVFRPATGSWYRLNSSDNSFIAVQFGAPGDLPAPGDYDGDGRADVSLYRPSAGSWYRLNSSNNQSTGIQFGVAEDKPIVGDFDGDGKSDIAVFRPSNGTWYRINSSNDTFSPNQFGVNGDLPVAADYDGDGRTDLAVYRPSVGDWYIVGSRNSAFTGIHFGIAEDKPAPADFDGDGRADLVVFRPGQGIWYLLRTTDGFTGAQFGTNNDIPTPGAFVR
jgi:uncharacterized delta-60 repeat protein